MKIDVLGAVYTVLDNQTEKKNPDLRNRSGLCEPYGRRILLRKLDPNTDTPENLARYRRETLRHEIIHAFLNESGLGTCSGWARNEEMVDWFAVQMPKLVKAFASAGCLKE